MSGLEKFDGTQAWFAQFKTLLFQKRPVPPRDRTIKTEEEDTYCDLSEELENIISAKTMDKNVVNEKTLSIQQKTNDLPHITLNDTTFIEEPSLWRQTTDESFENTERLCDQTNNFNQTLCLSDQTNLENVEPPSFLFENTLMGNGTFQLSPTKMVGFNRPPTIFEESVNTTNNSDESSFSFKTIGTYLQKSDSRNSTESSSFSFKTAGTHAHKDDLPNTTYSTVSSSSHYKPAETNTQKSESGSEQYETADESLKETQEKLDDNYTKDVTLVCESILTTNIQDDSTNKTNTTTSAAVCETFPSYKRRPFFTDDITSNSLSDKTRTLSSSCSRNFDPSTSNITTESKNTMSDVSSLLEDSIDVANNRRAHLAPDQTEMTLDSLQYTRTGDESDLLDLDEMLEQRNKAEDTSDVISLSSDDGADNDYKQNKNDDSVAINSGKEFNDTIEEMEYIMEQGMKYLTEKGAVPKVNSSASGSKLQSHIPTLKQKVHTPSNVYSQRLMKNTENMETDSIFKMPSSFRNQKAASESKKKKKFGHIISPVGAYINLTPTVPLVTTVRPTNDLYRSKLVRELEYEKHNPKPLTERNIPSKNTAGLPRKVYIASEFQTYVDERTPVTIPGGNKIHRYLSAAPTVMKHEGRIKVQDDEKGSHQPNVTIDETLADVSVVSGNVSLLTIKDARKIPNS